MRVTTPGRFHVYVTDRIEMRVAPKPRQTIFFGNSPGKFGGGRRGWGLIRRHFHRGELSELVYGDSTWLGPQPSWYMGCSKDGTMKCRLMKFLNQTCKRFRAQCSSAHSIASLAMALSVALPAAGQVIPISPEAQQAHATITSYEGPVTCIACHEQQARDMFGSVHYQEMGNTPNVANIDGPAGKGSNGGLVMNSYCGTPATSSRATCATCHVGNGRIPSTEMSLGQLANIDCMMCHQDAYKRTPAGPFEPLTFPGADGSLHTIQSVIEDETGFDFIPDTAKMAISILQAAQTVHLPTRISCLRCHAGAGGSDGGKRGDISTVNANPSLTSDVHMSSSGADLSCANCHSAGGHRVMGRGVDLRPNDSTQPLACARCHTERPHGDFSARAGASRDVHAMRVACQSCHIPHFAKDKSTEMERDWLHADFSPTACRGQGGWVPSEVRASNVVPTYQWFDGTSLASVLGQVPVQDPQGEYLLALPNGSVQSTGAKLFPMKLHRSNSAIQDSTGLLIPHSTFAFFTSGEFAQAVAAGQLLSGMDGPASVVPVKEYQTINHGVEVSENALQCGACHSSYTSGGPVRMNLQVNLGYAPKGPATQVCSQCHGTKTSKGFVANHDKHVRDKGYDCSTCHNFSRSERGLTRVSAIRPAAPGGPAAAVLSETEIKLVWADNSSSESGFRIERSADGVSFSEIGMVGANVTAAFDSGLLAGNSYYYRVRSYNSVGTSDYSMTGRATPTSMSPTEPPPAMPTALTATAVSASRVDLTWTDNANNETGFGIERSTDGSAFTQVALLGANVTTFGDPGLSGATTYYYRAYAFNDTGASPYSALASVTTPASPPPPPAAPTGLTVSAGDARVALSWNASDTATTYKVKRSDFPGGPYNIVASGLTGTSYVDTAVLNGATYYYVVTAANAGGESSNSNEVAARPQAPVVLPPTELQVQPLERKGIQLEWKQSVSPNITQNRIYRATSPTGPFSLRATISAGTKFVEKQLVRGRAYYYVVTALDDAGRESDYSNMVSAFGLAANAVADEPPAIK